MLAVVCVCVCVCVRFSVCVIRFSLSKVSVTRWLETGGPCSSQHPFLTQWPVVADACSLLSNQPQLILGLCGMSAVLLNCGVGHKKVG
jgi:hypothetical protein